MAIAIKSIPTLENKAAQAFVKSADAALQKKGTIDFTKQVKTANAILNKAKLQ